MAILLKDYVRFNRRWLLEVESGALREAGEGIAHGFVVDALARVDQPAHDQFAAIYADSGELWFQTGADRWSVTALEIDHTVAPDFATVTVTVTNDGAQLAIFSYPNPANDPVNRMDPTFDYLEAEAADFFLFMSNALRSKGWRRGILDLWTVGLPVTPGTA